MEDTEKQKAWKIWYSEATKVISTKELAGYAAAVFSTRDEWFRFIELLVMQSYRIQ